jgi:Protein of unknown function (DUF3575)
MRRSNNTGFLLLLLLFTLFPLSLYGQKNVLKGRFVPLVGRPSFSTMGLGYERFVNDRVSVQLIFNRFGFDNSGFDGSKRRIFVLAPEMRYHFKQQEFKKNRSWFSIFYQYHWIRRENSTFEISIPEIPGLEYRRAEAFGVLLGIDLFLTKKLSLEVFGGLKYQKEFRVRPAPLGNISWLKEASTLPRAGMNLCFKF